MTSDAETTPFDLSSAEFRRWAKRATDFATAWLERENHDPVLHRANGAELDAALQATLPVEGCDFDTVFEEFENIVARHCRANGHPRYFAYVSASADPAGIIAEFLAATLNQNVTAWRSGPGAATVERRVLQWLDEMTGFNGGNGILVGGGSAANFNALAMAVAKAGNGGVRRDDMVVYLSADTHFSLAKAARILGVKHVRSLPLDEHRRMHIDALREAIDSDLSRGLHPLLACASAGTANCGAIDPIRDIAVIAKARAIWLHIDGAYGAPAALTDSHRRLRDDFALADSMSIDPHKWLFAPLDVGCLLFRDAELARETFAESAAYTVVTQTDPIEAHAFFDYGMELSRRFRALKLWFAFKLHGSSAYAEAIERNIALREYLDERIQANSKLELLASGLSISCFRVTREGADTETLNGINKEVLETLLESGRFLLSPTELDGAFALRVCIVNFRTRANDIDQLLEAIDAANTEIFRRA